MQEFKFTGKATMLFMGTFGIVAVEVRDFKASEVAYAQYANAIRVDYLRKGKRKTEGVVKGYNPWYVLVEGHDIPSPADHMEKVEGGSITRHASYSEEWDKEANAYVARLKEDGYNVLWDCIDHKVNTKF